MSTMVTREYTVRFLTPAFLGDANQDGAWRTPPFKALLRQWWRVAYVAGREPTAPLVARMREVEGRTFGNAWLDANSEDRNEGRKNGHQRSNVRLRLEALQDGAAWTPGTQSGVAPMRDGIDTSYAWFGLIKRKDRVSKQALPDRTGIKPSAAEGERVLKLAFPEDRQDEIELTLRLIHTFGQVGSRARTGWGAIHLDGTQPLARDELEQLSRDGKDCLGSDWAHALGRDDQGLWIWESGPEFKDWTGALTKVAELRRQVRTALKGAPDLRPLFGFADAARMPSPLRWRVYRSPQGDRLGVRIFALPHRIPAEGKKDSSNRYANDAWSKATGELGRASWLKRLG